ncbi:unnamed protein product [Dracunculus medinensis]|uniref:Letm1 RBD domain-containing protein n=1 Tax=Dracunculus medinensis TaxID=318479 RepID=A0A0N4UEZ3_DRAME|nr:unnamed protein product [Dracunculus medinensis]
MLRRIVAVVVSTRNSSFPSHPRIRLYSSRNLLRERKFQAFDMIRYASTEKTKVEKTLEMLKDDLKQEQSEKDRSKERDLNKTIAIKVPLTKRIMNELKHYYHGFRLLALEVRLSSRYLWRVARGHSLMRRERQQLVRTVSDLFRLLPFSVFIIVPFMEFALPLFIKLFPNMLPSTFKDATKEEENLRRKLKVRLEMAKFLQDTIAEIGLVRKSQSTDQSASKAFEFAEFMKKVRTEGGYVSNAELFKFTKLFEDELTLDNLSLSSLRALCRMLDIQPLGSPEILRFQLNLKLRELKADDKQIALEGGVDVLNINDLQTACRARGMRSFGMSEFRLKSQLKQWLELSLNDNVPPSLLLLSRAIYVPEDITFADRLKALLSSLPSSIAEQARQKLTELEGDKINYKARLDLIREIEIGLQKERESMEETKKIVVESKLVADNTSTLLGSEPIVSGAEGVAAAEVGVKQPSVAGKDLETLENIIHGGVVLEAKHDIDELKEKLSGRREDLMEVDALMNDLTETKGAKILHRRINHIIANVDSLVAKLEEKRRHIAETVADPAIEDENKAKSH